MLDGRDWRRKTGAPADILQQLKKAAPAALPASYVDLLSFSDGGEGPLPLNPLWLQLDSAQAVIEGICTRNHGRVDLEGFLIFGSNGGGEYLAFDLGRGYPWPIVTMHMIAGPESAQVVAPDFDSIVELIGVE